MLIDDQQPVRAVLDHLPHQRIGPAQQDSLADQSQVEVAQPFEQGHQERCRHRRQPGRGFDQQRQARLHHQRQADDTDQHAGAGRDAVPPAAIAAGRLDDEKQQAGDGQDQPARDLAQIAVLQKRFGGQGLHHHARHHAADRRRHRVAQFPRRRADHHDLAGEHTGVDPVVQDVDKGNALDVVRIDAEVDIVAAHGGRLQARRGSGHGRHQGSRPQFDARQSPHDAVAVRIDVGGSDARMLGELLQRSGRGDGPPGIAGLLEHRQDDVAAGACQRSRQLIVFGRGGCRAEIDIDRNLARARFAQLVDHRCVRAARPWPHRYFLQAGRVDRHHHDVIGRFRGHQLEPRRGQLPVDEQQRSGQIERADAGTDRKAGQPPQGV